MTAPVHVQVFQKNASTSIATVTSFKDLQWTHELNADGFGSFKIHLGSSDVTGHPTLLNGGNMVKLTLAGEANPFFGFIIENVNPVLTGDGENADRWVTVSGRGPRSVLQSSILFPENQGIGALYSLRDTFSEDRPFDFSSYIGSWKVIADWVTPHGVVQHTDTTGVRGGSGGAYPTSWPDGTAQWIWITDPTLTAAVGVNWFRGDFNLSSATTIGIWASGDNRLLTLRVDGQEVASDDPDELYGWKKTYAGQAITLDAGNHTIAAAVENRSGPGGFLCTVGTLDTAGNLATVLLRTNTTDWQVHDDGTPPGWLHGQVIVKMIQESQLRSELPTVTLNFGTTTDTASNAWTYRINRSFRVGSDLLECLSQLIVEGDGMDADMSPNLVLSAWLRRGVDRTASVVFAKDSNITGQAPTASYSVRNSVLVRFKNGWSLVEDAASIAAHGRQSVRLDAGEADTVYAAQALAQAYIDEVSGPRITLPLETKTPSAAPTPEKDFGLGDVITAPMFDESPGDARVMSITGSVDENVISWELNLYPEP